ncbi:MAG: hypothetical protein NVSMB34_10080 [Variovorax sp.]
MGRGVLPTNRLALETSPYLLQHANDPVDVSCRPALPRGRANNWHKSECLGSAPADVSAAP